MKEKFQILTFQEALNEAIEYKKKHLLLGNGFSIAWNDKIFSYKSLYESVNFQNRPRLETVFQALKTTDFEYVLRTLNDISKIYQIYSKKIGINEIEDDYIYLQNLLIETITDNHPPNQYSLLPDEKISCRRFLQNFDNFYTTNYDILLYWVLMFDELDKKNEIQIKNIDDGFREGEEQGLDYVTWEVENTGKQNVFYVHGALHLFDNKFEFQKYSWIRTGISLIDQITEALSNDKYPMFVSEGDWKQKKDRIQHNGYMNRCLRSLNSIGGCLFIYGFGFNENDEHISKEIFKNRKLKRIFVSLHGRIDSDENKKIIKYLMDFDLLNKITFYDSSTAHIWR